MNEPLPTAEHIHIMEQQWPTANAALDDQLNQFRKGIPSLEEKIGLTGPSVTFAYMRGFLLKSRMANGEAAVEAIEIMCAAAFTRLINDVRTQDNTAQQAMMAAVKINEAVDILKDLARASRAEDEMMQFEKGLRDDNC
jgi:hypothetical protein